jgi:putative lipoic acid-binding regulatory protein
MNKTFDKEAFKEKLEAQMTFPALYMFKFIVPTGQELKVAALLPNNAIETKSSSKGKYVSVTIQAMMASSGMVLDVYERASKIEGVISL